MSEVVPGGSLWEQAVRLAGALAEAGETEIELVVGGKSRRLAVRGTDLPGEIEKGVGGALLCRLSGIRVGIEATGLRWEPGSEALRARIHGSK